MALPRDQPSAVAGAQVRSVRGSKGVSLRGLARAIGVSPATMTQIERGRTGLTVARLQRIAEAIGVPVREILETDPTVRSDADDGPEPLTPVLLTPSRTTPASDWRLYEPLAFDLVLHAALEEFVDVGYHGATVRGIASRAGLSVSGIYHYYPSKQHMLVAILDYTMADLLRRARGAQAEGRDPVERFSLQIEHLVLFHTHRAELGFVGAAEKRSLEPENALRIGALRTQQQRLVDTEVEDAVRLGHFRSDSPRERARAIVTMCTALPTWWRPEGPCSPGDMAAQYVAFAQDLMLRPDANRG